MKPLKEAIDQSPNGLHANQVGQAGGVLNMAGGYSSSTLDQDYGSVLGQGIIVSASPPPWKEYLRTMFVQSTVVHPKGWLPWNASKSYTNTVYYSKYENRDGGARTSGQVSWKGVHPNMSKKNA
ncbi:hypothetical protein L7F22_006138 [Adiantum nelumboides]|nr:hypothetical protein [Adiantum nelumboides]